MGSTKEHCPSQGHYFEYLTISMALTPANRNRGFTPSQWRMAVTNLELPHWQEY